MNTEHCAWLGSSDPDDKSGIATITAGGKTMELPLPNFETYMRLLDLIRASRIAALQAQTDYLRGVINRLLDH